MNKILLVCCGLFSMSCQAEFWQWTHRESQKFEGVWQGVATQDDQSTWPITVTLSSDVYLINYPSLNCGGMLKKNEEYVNSLVFIELSNCHNNGKVILIQDSDSTMRYYWYYENNGKQAAFATLSRQVASAKD